MNKPTTLSDKRAPALIDVTIVDAPTNSFDALQHQAEAEWLPYIGPTAMVAARALVWNGDGHYSTERLARDLGVGQTRLWQALHRLQRAKLCVITNADVDLLAWWPPNEKRTNA